jgi:hypothetical protein
MNKEQVKKYGNLMEGVLVWIEDVKNRAIERFEKENQGILISFNISNNKSDELSHLISKIEFDQSFIMEEYDSGLKSFINYRRNAYVLLGENRHIMAITLERPNDIIISDYKKMMRHIAEHYVCLQTPVPYYELFNISEEYS